ncbi:DUF2938 domain-containing protein [Marinobacterium sp. D7]|uniref:DUF2938 domain-containing protein n=1 Tax=Marinobacterium ramblicola TaxID=2849041 RepID=UPI001C2D6C6B|nr:DUF2938 domain-containing protein [Marinobacterium ramblicola]MBV1788227.1 DUF2938 domain-containing protein [Marinobacterium ramblicola]
MNTLLHTLAVGVGATAIMDLWAVARRSFFGIALPNYRLVGRWIGHMRFGRFRHEAIAASEPICGEGALGWSMHYLIGIAFATLLIGLCGVEWLRQPTLVPALMVGIGTVLAPFLLMQPGMGAGIAASRTPRPGAARVQSLINHGVFGLGLYIAAWLVRLLI